MQAQQLHGLHCKHAHMCTTPPVRTRRRYTHARTPPPATAVCSAVQEQRPQAADPPAVAQQQQFSERGLKFLLGPSFYRPESAVSRDLSVLAAAVYKRRHGRLRVLDLMAGSGIRGARYLKQAGADAVWTNDLNPQLLRIQALNLLCSDPQALGASEQQQTAEALWSEASPVYAEGLRIPAQQWERDGSSVRVSQIDANRILTSMYLAEDYYDVIDIDSFGSETRFIGSALDAVKHEGLLYLTSTDGFSSGGRRPARSLGAYGAFLRAGLPISNEQGLRMLIGVAVREGAARRLRVTPVFSHFSFHGPVFRTMLKVSRDAAWEEHNYGFLGYCHMHGQTTRVPWKSLSTAVCTCCGNKMKGKPLALSGPIWTGPLHDKEELTHMAEEAASRGWTGHSFETADKSGKDLARTLCTKKAGPRPLEEVLEVLLSEADERLRPGFINIENLGKHLKMSPQRDALIAVLREKGFAASRCHLETKAFRTSATMRDVVKVCSESLGIPGRPDSDVCQSLTLD